MNWSVTFTGDELTALYKLLLEVDETRDFHLMLAAEKIDWAYWAVVNGSTQQADLEGASGDATG